MGNKRKKMTDQRKMLYGIVALDVGHSAVKISFNTPESKEPTIDFFPSVIIPAFSISDDAESTRAETDTVTVGRESFFVGQTAEIQGGRNLENIVEEEWVRSPSHTALVAAALKRVARQGGLEQAEMLVVGLPTSLYKRQRDDLRAAVAEICNKEIEIKVLPQPMGAFQYNMLDKFGFQAAGRSFSNESWGVVEVGYFSTDFMIMRGDGRSSRWVDRAGGICSGVRVAAERLAKLISEEVEYAGKRGITVGLREAESALQTGFVKHFGKIDVSAQVAKAAEVIVSDVFRAATKYLESEAASLDGIVIAGGGAPLIKDALKEKWPHVLMMPNSRFAVVEGYRRFGLGVMAARKQIDLLRA